MTASPRELGPHPNATGAPSPHSGRPDQATQASSAAWSSQPATARVASPATISATEPDWSRERHPGGWAPSFSFIATLRGYDRWRARGPVGRLISKWYVLKHRFWSAVAGADIQLGTRIGGGLLLTHPNGVVVHPGVTIGPNCLILQQVTLGTGGPVPGVPTLGGHVDIGAGAKILGGVRIGDHAKIGANAVVLCDVPPHYTAVGIPARLIPPRTS